MKTEVTYYDNTRFNNFDNGGMDTSVVKGQFPTGCADPYIMRWNGMFYLYVTTSGLTNYGLRAWKSKDLLNWEQCQGKGLPLGYVIDDKDEDGRYTQNAYAPEVYYFNGKFYMIISPGPVAVSEFRGHRILVADNPEGPFKADSEQIDRRIDGSLLIDDDETIYFGHATPFGITIHEFKNMKELGEGALIKASDGTGAWTEGPGFTKVRGHYYLTYTGCHYQTPGYQVIYATTDKLDKTNIQTVADSFKRGPSRVVLLNCDLDEGHVGLGHSINFMGPDLDSYYICYHNLDKLYEDGMTHRSFNIDRLLVGEGFMTCVHNKKGSIYPHWPFFESYNKENLEEKEGLLLSKVPSKARFSAEFNSKNGGEVKYVFSYKDDKNYAYVLVNYSAKEVLVNLVSDGKEKLLGKGTLKYNYSNKNLHTIRVAYDGTLNVYFDNMRKVSLKADLPLGKVGYMFTEKDIEVGYTAISAEANGSSDHNEIKQALEEIPAFDFDYDLSCGGELTSLENIKGEYNLTKGMSLSKADTLGFKVNFKEDDNYALVVAIHKKDLEKPINLYVDDKKYALRLPKKFDVEDDIVKVNVEVGEISKGVHEIKVIGDNLLLVSISFVQVNNELDFKFEDINFVTDGYRFQKGKGELLVEGRRNFASLTHQKLSDVEIRASIRLDSVTEEKGSIGLLIRQNNYAYSDVPKQDFKDANTHLQGYYLEIKQHKVSVWKYNFGDVKSFELASQRFILDLTGTMHNYQFNIIGNSITIYMDNEMLFKVSDPVAFQVGALGLYSYRSSGAYKDIKIKSLLNK